MVGSNNAGKSNIIAAFEWVLGARSPYQLRADETDFFDPKRAITIVATIGAISGTDKSALMSVTTSKQQRGALSSKPDPLITITVSIPPLGGTNAPEDSFEEESESEGTSKPTLELNFWGFSIRQKAADRRREIVQLVRVAAQRSVEDDLKASQWTPYGELMKAILEASPQYTELTALLEQVNDKIQKVFATQKDALVDNARIVSYVDDITFQLTRENNPAELLRYLEILVAEDGHQINLNKLGTGTQSAVIIGMLELVLRAKTGKIKLFMVEEPDAFIHPHGVRHLAGLMRQITDSPTSQVVLTTHSPQLLATLPPRDIVRVEKCKGATKVFQSPGTLGDPVFARFVDANTAEMFFAQRVILVEGDTERFLLPPLSAMLKDGSRTLDFDRRQTSVISMDGKNSIMNFLQILHEFEIEARAILDNDFLNEPICTRLVAYLRGIGKTIDDSDAVKLRSTLWSNGIMVLKKGEIEDYIPEADVATLTGRPLADVQKELASSKTSTAFRRLFQTGKPIYGRQLANHYVGSGAIPIELEKLIRLVSA